MAKYLKLLILGFAFMAASLARADPTITPLVSAYVADVNPTALIVMRDGQTVERFGRIAEKVGVASVRKSLLSALYGIAVAEGRVDLSSTLGDLGIDDKTRLTDEEKKATVRDLLTARSGVYLPAAHETADIKAKRPARGSHAPGTHWFYNNWDFNVLGTIYRKATGEDVFQSFAKRIATPIGMEDFSSTDGRYAYIASSEHPAYPFRMSARDLARFGQLFLNEGRWEDRQIVPAAWVRESGQPFSVTSRGKRGYGYMWWSLPDVELGANARMAAGYGGQFVVIVPSKRLVVVQTMAAGQSSGRARSTDFVGLVRRIAAASP